MVNAMQPDAEHLHHVIYMRFETLKFRHDRARHFFINSLMYFYFTIFNFPYIAKTVYFSDNTPAFDKYIACLSFIY